MVMPNMRIAPDSERETVEVFYDYGSKDYGIRKRIDIVKDGVYIETSKSLCMTKEQLAKLLKDAEGFIKDR